jgi:hypothetical protein
VIVKIALNAAASAKLKPPTNAMYWGSQKLIPV